MFGANQVTPQSRVSMKPFNRTKTLISVYLVRDRGAGEVEAVEGSIAGARHALAHPLERALHTCFGISLIADDQYLYNMYT